MENNNNNNNTTANNNSTENAITINKESLTDKRYVGILLSVLSLIASIILTLIFTPNVLTYKYFIFQCVLNVAISVGVLYVVKPLFGKNINEIFKFKNAKTALILSVGIFILMVYFFILILKKMNHTSVPFKLILAILIYSLTIGLFNGIVIVFLTSEGYFHLENKSITYKYIYAVAGAFIYGLFNIIITHGGFEAFFQYFTLMFALATVYILSRNVLIVMIINAVFWFEYFLLIVVLLSSLNNLFEMAFGNSNTIINILFVLVLVYAAVMLYIMDKPKEKQPEEFMV
jgi:hypothetical protein